MSQLIEKTIDICINCKHVASSSSREPERFRCFAPENKLGVSWIDGSQKWKKDFCIDIRTGPQCISYEYKPIPTSTLDTAFGDIPASLKKLSIRQQIKNVTVDDL